MSDDHKQLTAEEENALNGIDLDLGVTASELEEEENPKKKKRKAAPVVIEQEEADDEDEPQMGDPRWHDYAMRQFTEEELDPHGSPFVHGLRRVARKLLGPIIKSGPEQLQLPTPMQGLEKVGKFTPATVRYSITFLWSRPEDAANGAFEVTYADVADVYWGNTDPDFLRHASATASTRAEARTLRKALGLGRIIASEERTLVPIEDSNVNGMIGDSQIRFIDVLCQRNDIDVMKYINASNESDGKGGKKIVVTKKYQRIQDVPCGVAVKMIEHLSGLQNDQKKISDVFKNYDNSWKR